MDAVVGRGIGMRTGKRTGEDYRRGILIASSRIGEEPSLLYTLNLGPLSALTI
jgi:hypothetical protein